MSGKEAVDSWLMELKDCVLLHFPPPLPPEMTGEPVSVAAVDLDSSEGLLLWRNSGLDSAEGKNLSECSIKMATTSLQNLVSMMEATVSSRGQRRLGPKTTPRLDAVIRFCSLF